MNTERELDSVEPPIVSPAACPRCGRPTRAGSPHVRISGSAVRVYCSSACLRELGRPLTAAAERSCRVYYLSALLAFVLFGATGWHFYEPRLESELLRPPAIAATLVVQPSAAMEMPSRIDTNSLDQRAAKMIVDDHWVHPLRGPRRMPQRDGTVFGAERPGDRPPSCRSGHCGVDIGGVWGEPVFATAEGQVTRVVRHLNPDHGGRYVRISHRDGTVVTQYFHLASIPPWIEQGTEVKAGQLIGLLGHTGIKRARPHLHFTISVKPDNGTETFIDPEPLIALWPVVEMEEHGPWIASTKPLPGVPHGAARRTSKRRHNRKSRDENSPINTDSAASDSTPAPPASTPPHKEASNQRGVVERSSPSTPPS